MSEFRKRITLVTLTIIGLALSSTLISSPPIRAQGGNPLTQTLPPGFVVETVVSGLDLPTTIDWSSDGRMFIAQKGGRVRVFHNGALLPDDFTDLSDQVNHYWDRGLVGMVVHPHFPEQPYVYLLFTYDPPGAVKDGTGARVARLIRVTANPQNLNMALPGSEVVLLGTNSTREYLGNENYPYDVEHPACISEGAIVPDCLPADSPNHGVGDVAFAPDGSLLVGNGEAGSWEFVDPRALRAQDVDSLAGKLLRLDPETGLGLPNNPFFDGDPASNRSKVWSYGLRMPFRIAFDPVTGEPYVGDVGQSDWEEINAGEGANFGWPCYEGKGRHLRFDADPDMGPICDTLIVEHASEITAPRFTYSHQGGLASITLGDFYIGTSYPVTYHNALFFADYSRRTIQYVTFDALGVPTAQDFGAEFGSAYSGIVDLRSGPDTNLYFAMLDALSNTASSIQRIRYIGGANAAPIARANVTPDVGSTPLIVHLDGQGSRDPESQPLSYLWELGDGVTSTLPSLTYTYAVTGTYAVTLTVTDDRGATSSDAVRITAGNYRPNPSFLTPDSSYRYAAGDVISFTVAVTDVEDAPFPPSGISWQALLHHGEHVHPNFATGTGTSGAFNTTDHGDDTWIELCVTATDTGGLSNTVCRNLLPRLIAYTYLSQPAGLRLIYDGQWRTTPLTVYAPVNGQRQLSAPLAQGGCAFQTWQDGGAQTRTVLIGSTPMTFTAQYGNCSAWLPIIAVPVEAPPAEMQP